ncbi:SNF1-related protein kinase catalytic subunit alpha KIN10, partial [Sesamum angolense]
MLTEETLYAFDMCPEVILEETTLVLYTMKLFRNDGRMVPETAILFLFFYRNMESGLTAEALFRNYRLGKTLGHGSFGKVKIAEHLRTGHKVAIKILNRRKMQSPDMEEKVRREIKICRLFVHPHVIRLYEVIETPAEIYVVMEYVMRGELFDYIVEKGRLQEDEARRFFQQIIAGVEYCHRNMVVHRDLKPENLLLDSKGNVKLADFGLSNIMRDGHFLRTSCGSPNYAAPESPASPREIMTQILGALQGLNVRWKKIGHYNMKCVFVHAFPDQGSLTAINHINGNHYVNSITSINSNVSQPQCVVKFEMQIIAGVEYCHRNLIVHRDLKAENLLLDSKGNVKLADFGLSNIMRDGHFLKTSCGSLNYAAPEILRGALYAGPEVDIWSCGVILYTLLCGAFPFDDPNIPNLFNKIKSGVYTLPRHLPPGTCDLISRMLLVDPMERITIPEIRMHPWFRVNLPSYLDVTPSNAIQHLEKLDEEVIQEVVRMGFERNEVVESVQNRTQNDATVAYYLSLDNRYPTSTGNLGAEFQMVMEQHNKWCISSLSYGGESRLVATLRHGLHTPSFSILMGGPFVGGTLKR